MSGAVIEFRTGLALWLDGDRWTVVGFDGTTVTLRCGQRVITKSLTEVVTHAAVLDAGETSGNEESSAAVLGSLSPGQMRELEQRARHVRELLTDEGPGVAFGRRCELKAEELGVSVRTVHRWIAGYRRSGVAGLADARIRAQRSRRIDPRWDALCLQILDRFAASSTPTRGAVIAVIAREAEEVHGRGTVPLPSTAAVYKRLAQLSKGRHAFGSAKGRRSVAERPQGVYGRLRAIRPGEYVVLDTTPLDVFAMEPVTLRWVPVELTVAMDLCTRCILGLRLTPVSTKAQDVANVLYQCVTPQASSVGSDEPEAVWPFHGVPRNVLVGCEQPDGVSQQRVGGLPACMPEAIVVDHGRQYLSSEVIAVCARLGITVQPAIPHKPTDKPTVERFFKTLRESLLQHLPAYKGPDVYSRGANVEGQAFYYVTELEQIIREWVGGVYHHSKHDGLCVPEVPGAGFSPAEMFELGVAKAGGLLLPSRPDLAYDFLDVAWRKVHHYGVEAHGQRYNGAGLNLYRNVRSPYGGAHAGKWPIFADVHDVRFAYFQDPDTKVWHRLEWEHAAELGQPFSQAAADYTKQIAVRTQRHVDPQQAVADMVAQWSRGEVQSRRDRSLARRISAQRADTTAGEPLPSEREEARQVASLPGVIDLLEHRERKAALEVVDDADVFDQYYAEHPDTEGLEVFDD